MLDCITLMDLIFLFFQIGILIALLHVTSRLFETRCQRLYQKDLKNIKSQPASLQSLRLIEAESRDSLRLWDLGCVARCLRCKIAK